VIETVRIDIGSGGLPSCARCGVPGAPTFHSATDVIASISKAAVDSNAVLMLGGAEAFGHAALPEIVGAAVASGWRRIGLQTAGGLLTVGGNAPGVLHAGVRHFEVVIVPSDSSTLAVDGPAPLDGIRELVAAASAAGVRIAVTAVLPTCRHGVAALPSAVADLAAVGVGSIRIVAEPESCTGPRALAAVVAACDTGVVNAVWVDVSGVDLPPGHAMHRATQVVS